MLRQFRKHVGDRGLFDHGDRLLVGISGGVDSVVLAHLLHEMNADFSLAHCNYGLRGNESDKDQAFCEKLAAKLDRNFYVLNLKGTFKQSKESLQESARKARYGWFDRLSTEYGYTKILTAHQADDQAETVLFNLSRGTGLKGLRGIAEQEGTLVRPMLIFTRDDVMSYAQEKGLRWREDSSNNDPKYTRNFIRHNVMPLMKKLNPAFVETVQRNTSVAVDEFDLLKESLESLRKKYVTSRDRMLFIQRKRLTGLGHTPLLLHHVLAPLGFTPTQIQAIAKYAVGSGTQLKVFVSPSHDLSIEREAIVIEPSGESPAASTSFRDIKTFEKAFFAERVPWPEKTDPHQLIVSRKDLTFPILLRTPKQGDRFQPFGMQGSKLLSDYLREQKLSHEEKTDLRVLENGDGRILWIPGYRSDERFRVQDNRRDLIKLTWNG